MVARVGIFDRRVEAGHVRILDVPVVAEVKWSLQISQMIGCRQFSKQIRTIIMYTKNVCRENRNSLLQSIIDVA